MEQHDQQNVIKEGVEDSFSTPSDCQALLPCSPAKGLTIRELRTPDHPPQVLAITPHTSASSSMPISNAQAGSVISKIEDLLLKMVDCIFGEGKELELHLRSRSRSRATDSETNGAAVTNSMKTVARIVRFPGRTAQEAWKFTVLLRILELSHEALVTGTVITKRCRWNLAIPSANTFIHSQIPSRDIYYKDPELFFKQTCVDRYVDDIAFSLGISRESLNVVAAAKGLIAGCLTVVKIDEDVLDCRVGVEGVLVPSMEEIEKVDMREARWVLVVEKEATFRSLAVSRFWETSPAGKGILVTGKGYPDIRTRALVQVLSTRDRFAGQSIHSSHLKIFALVDYDPDGLAIMSTYKHGSISLAHENNTLIAPRIEWLGVTSNVIKDAHRSMSQGWLRLTSRDRIKAVKMLEKPVLHWHIEPTWRRELQVMLMLNIKAEIQILGEYSHLEDYLSSELQSYMSL